MPQEKPRNKSLVPGPRNGATAASARRAGVSADRDHAKQLAAEVDQLRRQLKDFEAKIEALEKTAHEDPLTGLLNRRGFERALMQAISYLKRYGGSAALLYLDLDRFKPVNDRHGHAAGDVVLQEIARLLKGSVRASDFAARLGGDEFALVLWNLDAVQMERKAHALEDIASRAEFFHAGERLDVGISVGGVMLSESDTLEDVLARADAQMYARKAARKAAR